MATTEDMELGLKKTNNGIPIVEVSIVGRKMGKSIITGLLLESKFNKSSNLKMSKVFLKKLKTILKI
jgi:hypothetical protein